MELLDKSPLILLCFFIVGVAICRIDAMNVRTGSAYSWVLRYIMAAVYAFGTILDSLLDKPIQWYEVAGVTCIGLFMWHSRKNWRHDTAPVESQRMPLQ